MNVVIIEDERLTAQRLRSQILKYDPKINVVAELASVEESVSWFHDHANDSESQVDLAFMDIHLGDGDSFRIIRELNLQLPIIFTTAFDEYMVKAFKVNSIDYLLKPINFEELKAAIDKYKSLRKAYSQSSADANIRELILQLTSSKPMEYKDRFMITVGTKIRSVLTGDIAYFYLEEKTVLLVTFDNTTLPVDYSLDKLLQLLDPKKFFRISRQFIVSLRSIHMVHTVAAGKLRLDLNPKSRQEVNVSLDRVTDFKAWLGKD